MIARGGLKEKRLGGRIEIKFIQIYTFHNINPTGRSSFCNELYIRLKSS